MDTALILAATTSALRHILENGLVEADVATRLGSDVLVTALPTDRVKLGEDERPQINLYLYRVRSRFLEAGRRDATLDEGMSFELAYLLSAYGAQDLQIEILLGAALEQMRRTPCLSGDEWRAILERGSKTSSRSIVSATRAALESPGLGKRLQRVEFAPLLLRPDETMQLWSMLHATYRPCAVFRANAFFDDQIDVEEEDSLPAKAKSARASKS